VVISLDSLPKRVRHWYKSHVYRVYNFRTLFDQEQATTDPQEKKRIRAKAEHPGKKAAQHAKYGISLKIPEEEVRRFGLAIIAEVKKKKSPKAIIQELIRENGQK